MLPVSILPVTGEAIDAAFALLFRHDRPADRARRIANAKTMIASGELDVQGLLVAQRGEECCGAILVHALPGGAGLIWAPQADDSEIAIALARFGCEWLRARRVVFASAFLPPDATAVAGPLEAVGFRQITGIDYLSLELGSAESRTTDDIRVSLIADEGTESFADTLMATYVDSLDCPELNGLRTAAQILSSYRAEARTPPDWYRIEVNGESVGVLLLRPDSDELVCELVYFGFISSARGRGLGRVVLRRAIRMASELGQTTMWLSVDQRNAPAQALYHRLGFVMFDQRRVWLKVFLSTDHDVE